MQRVLATLVVALGLGGCAVHNVTALKPQAAHVEIVSGTPTGCQPLGDVFGSSTAEGDPQAAMEGARNDLRNRTAARGGTHVALQSSTSDTAMGMWTPAKEVTLAGAAYRCASPTFGPPGGDR